MTAEANNVALDDEINTTAPQSKPAEWKMPEPVFRRTSGKLPKGFDRGIVSSATGEQESPARAPNSVETYVEPKPKNPTLKFILVLLGLVAMIAFIAVFLTVLYFFFLR